MCAAAWKQLLAGVYQRGYQDGYNPGYHKSADVSIEKDNFPSIPTRSQMLFSPCPKRISSDGPHRDICRTIRCRWILPRQLPEPLCRLEYFPPFRHPSEWLSCAASRKYYFAKPADVNLAAKQFIDSGMVRNGIPFALQTLPPFSPPPGALVWQDHLMDFSVLQHPGKIRIVPKTGTP